MAKSETTVKAKEAGPVTTAAEAAAVVTRRVAEVKNGKPTGRMITKRVTAEEVFAFKDHGDHVVVVTVDGQKLTGRKA